MGKPKYRTATTTYPCYIPVLGDSAGAGRTRLTQAQKYVFKLFQQTYLYKTLNLFSFEHVKI